MKKILSLAICLSIMMSFVSLAINESDELPVNNWAATASSFNAPNGVGREVPENAIDGNLQSHWHSSIEPKAEGPHFITIELPAITEVGGYRYYPRPGGGAGVCTEYAIYLSLDNQTFQKVAEGKWENNDLAKTVLFQANYKTKFVRLQLVSAVAGYGSAGEIRVLAPQKGKSTLNITADVKKEDINPKKQEEAINIVLAEDELPVDGWTFDASSVNENKGVPTEVPEKTIDGKLKSHWHTMINPKAAGPHYITIILPEDTVVSAFRYYPRSDGGAGVCTKYEIHVSHDGENFAKIAEGEWAGDTKAKTAEFSMNVKAKAVKLVIVQGRDGYGSAGELRLVGENSKKKTITAKEFVENQDAYTFVPVPYEKISVKVDKTPNRPPIYMIDGLADSYYHSEITTSPGRLPVTMDFDLGYAYNISGLAYTPRMDGIAGHFKYFEVEYSLDKENYEFFNSFTFNKVDNDKKQILFDEPIRARYIRIIVIDGHGEYATCAEMEFLQTKADYKKDDEADDIEYKLTIGSKDIMVRRYGEDSVVTTDVAPFIYKGSTMIPLRGLLEQMGADINWVPFNQKIEVFTEREDFMEFQIEEYNVYINEVRYNTPVAPMIKDGRTFIPLRFVSENMGYNVSWNGKTKEITITNK